MNTFEKIWCRTFQTVMKAASAVLPWREPEILHFGNGTRGIGAFVKKKSYKKVLVVTGPNVYKRGLADELVKGLEENGVPYALFNRVVNNPTIDNIEEAFALYKAEGCDAIIALGGGSPMDLAKVVGARAAKPCKPVKKMKGLLKIMKRIPDLYAIPTTAGSGSETTIAAVVSDSETHEKYPINDLSLIPRYAILDPRLTAALPPQTTATTGMDALTHAVEAYIGRSNTKKTRENAEKAVKLIFDNLLTAYEHGDDLTARAKMQEASYYAGVAFTRAYVGYVHALAHALGGFYGTPHGLANSVLLPVVLEYYGESAHEPLARLAEIVGIKGGDDAAKATKFIEAIKDMNAKMLIPATIDGIDPADVPEMAKRAAVEGNPLYPVPRLLGADELEKIYGLIM